MSQTRRHFAASALALGLAPLASPTFAQKRPTPDVIVGGGASGGPADSRVAYEQAASQGADFLEGGLVVAKDGALLIRSDNELSAATDVAARPEYGERRTTRVIDGATREGWFVEDFTLAELKSLTLTGGPRDRRDKTADRPTILTFEDLLAIARAASVRQARVVGVCVRLRHPHYFASIDLPLEARLAQIVSQQGYNAPAAALMIAGDSPESLKTLGGLTRARRLLCLGAAGAAPPTSPEALATLARQVWGIALPLDQVLDLSDPRAVKATALPAAAQGAGLKVQAWPALGATAFPPPPFKPGDTRRLLAALFSAGVDGVCWDNAAALTRARSEGLAQRKA